MLAYTMPFKVQTLKKKMMIKLKLKIEILHHHPYAEYSVKIKE